MNNTEDLTSRIEFIESHIGGNNDDSVNTFKEQKELIDKNTTDYARLIDYYNKLDEYTKPGQCEQYKHISSHFCLAWHLKKLNLREQIEMK